MGNKITKKDIFDKKNKIVNMAVSVTNKFQRAQKFNAKKVEELEIIIKNEGYELFNYKLYGDIVYVAKKENVKISAKSKLSEGDYFNKVLGKLIAVSRIIEVIFSNPCEGENDG